MSSRVTRRAQRGSARSRRTPVRPQGGAGRFRVPWIPIVVVVGVVAVVGVIAYLILQSGKSATDQFARAQELECRLTAAGACEDPDPGLPGQWVNLPEAFADGSTLAHYGASSGPTTNGHVTSNVDYSKEVTANAPNGLPPTGGAHWGQGTCGDTPANAPAFCGPVPWGAYRDPWPAEATVHNMEHGGVVVWYNSTDTSVRDQLEEWVIDEGNRGGFVVLTPYSDIPKDTIALTAWARRDVFPVSDLTEKRVKDFIVKLNCHFNPEGFDCGSF